MLVCGVAARVHEENLQHVIKNVIGITDINDIFTGDPHHPLMVPI